MDRRKNRFTTLRLIIGNKPTALLSVFHLTFSLSHSLCVSRFAAAPRRVSEATEPADVMDGAAAAAEEEPKEAPQVCYFCFVYAQVAQVLCPLTSLSSLSSSGSSSSRLTPSRKRFNHSGA